MDKELINENGETVKLDPPTGDELPKNGFDVKDAGFQAPLADGTGVTISVEPTSSRLQLLEPFAKWDGTNPQNIDLNWEVLINMKINKFLTANIATQMIYDHDIPVPVKREENGVKVMGTGPRLQFKEVLSLGLSYKF